VEGRETVKFVTIDTKYKATMTRNDYEKNMYYPSTINNNAIIQLFNYFLDFYCVFWEKWDNFDRNPFRTVSTICAQRVGLCRSSQIIFSVARVSDSRSCEFFFIPDVATQSCESIVFPDCTSLWHKRRFSTLRLSYLCLRSIRFAHHARKRTLTHIFNQIG